MDYLNDEKTIQAIQSGDEQAIDNVITKYSKLLWSIASAVDMIRAGLCLYNLHALLLAQFAQYHPNVLLDLSVYLHSAIFWRKYYLILTPP